MVTAGQPDIIVPTCDSHRHLQLVITQWAVLRPAIEEFAASSTGVPITDVDL